MQKSQTLICGIQTAHKNDRNGAFRLRAMCMEFSTADMSAVFIRHVMDYISVDIDAFYELNTGVENTLFKVFFLCGKPPHTVAEMKRAFETYYSAMGPCSIACAEEMFVALGYTN